MTMPITKMTPAAQADAKPPKRVHITCRPPEEAIAFPLDGWLADTVAKKQALAAKKGAKQEPELDAKQQGWPAPPALDAKQQGWPVPPAFDAEKLKLAFSKLNAQLKDALSIGKHA